MPGEGVAELNPVFVEESIQGLVGQIAKGVRVVSEAHRKKLTADRLYDHAFAVAYMAHEGAQTEKKYAAEKATQQERIDKDVAEVAYQHAQRQMRALEGQLSAFQTIAKSVGAAYNVAGAIHGRGQ
jgi:hypothetical protein